LSRYGFRFALVLSAFATGCSHSSSDFSLSKRGAGSDFALSLGQRVPDTSEAAATGPLTERVVRGSPAFAELVRSDDPDIVFKDEEHTGADRMMTPRLRALLSRLARRVSREWPDVRLRVTEAWDERGEHGPNSIHYEGRAADITTSDTDPERLGRLARLAVESGFDWVFFENASHVHVSVRRAAK
jgi:hypothetical protein